MQITNKKQHGFSMVEVLVSLLVIGVGLLGLSGLQIASVKSTNNAHSRNVANNLAMELSDRMRANPQGVDNGFYENNIDCTSIEASQCKTSSFCSPQQIARIDVQEIMCGILIAGNQREGGAANLLPNGSVEVDHNVDCDTNIDNDNETTINVSWNHISEHKDQELASADMSIEICVLP